MDLPDVMRRACSIIVCLLLAEPCAVACKLAGYYAEPPNVDRGVVAGKSPAAPMVVEAYVFHHELETENGGGCPFGPQQVDSCDGVVDSYLFLRLRGAGAAALFRLDHGKSQGMPDVDHAVPYAVEDGDVIVRAEFPGAPPLSFELSAFDDEGYASESVHVEVTQEFYDRADGGCAVGRSPASVWVVVLCVLVVRRLLYRRPNQNS